MITNFHNRIPRVSLHLPWNAAVVLFSVVLLAACQNHVGSSKPVSAQELCMFAHSSELHLGTTDEAGVVKWIKAAHKVEPKQSVKEDGDSRVVDFFWKQGDRHWSASVRDGKLVRMSEFDIDSGLTFDEVVTFWGAPEFVYGYIGLICERSCLYSLGLDYPRLGFSISHSGLEAAQDLWKTGAAAIAVRKEMSVTEIHCYRSGSMKEVLKDAFGSSVDSTILQMSMRSLWSGFDALVPVGSK